MLSYSFNPLSIFTYQQGDYVDIADHWKTIFDTLNDGIMIIDSSGNIIATNLAAEKLTGYTEKELKGNSCKVFNCSGCKIFGNKHGEPWCELFAIGKVKKKQCLMKHKTKRIVHAIKSASVLKNKDGHIIGAIEIFTDISENVRKKHEIISLEKTFNLEDGYHGILGKSSVMQNLFKMIENVAISDTPVMIHGKSGTGKELIAKAIHKASGRRSMPFIKVNCAALNESLLESELFGHIKGAFTGANRTRVGRFEAAHQGSIFLDEIGDIPLSTQVKLLRVLEEKEIERVGDHESVLIDVRIITATNKNLEDLIVQGLFREDLFFRINVFPLSSPSLAPRHDDIHILVQHFIKLNSRKNKKKIPKITPEAMEKLVNYSWPGNVRELRNAIEYAFVLCSVSKIDIEHLPPKIITGGYSFFSKNNPKSSMEKKELINTLRETGGNQSQTAKKLGVSRVTIWKRMKKYNINLHNQYN